MWFVQVPSEGAKALRLPSLQEVPLQQLGLQGLQGLLPSPTSPQAVSGANSLAMSAVGATHPTLRVTTKWASWAVMRKHCSISEVSH